MSGLVDYIPLVMLIEANWYEFVDYAGSEEAAEQILNTLKSECGMA